MNFRVKRLRRWQLFLLVGMLVCIYLTNVALTNVAQAGVADLGPSKPSGIKQGPLQAKPMTSGPSGNPTLGGINKILVTPLPATVNNQIKFTIQGWGRCTSIQIAFGDSPQSYVLYDIDFAKPFEQTYIYRAVTNPGKPYVMSVTGRATQPSPCTGQATVQVDVRPVPVGMKTPSSTVAKAQQSMGGNIGGVPGALKESLVEAKGAQKQGAIPKSPPPPPQITSVWTAGIKPGAIINVVGKNFGARPGRVRLIRDNNPEGDRYLDITDWRDQFVQGRVPSIYPLDDTSNRALEVSDISNRISNWWNVHSGVVIEEEAREVPAKLFEVISCGGGDECYAGSQTAASFGAWHWTGASLTGSSGTDIFSLKQPLTSGWRLHSCRYVAPPDPPRGIDGGIGGCEPGRTQNIKLSVRWFRDAGVAESAQYTVSVVVVGPKGTAPW